MMVAMVAFLGCSCVWLTPDLARGESCQKKHNKPGYLAGEAQLEHLTLAAMQRVQTASKACTRDTRVRFWGQDL